MAGLCKMGDLQPRPIKTLNAGDGGGANNCMLISVMAAVPDIFNIHSTSDKNLSTPDPIRHRHGGYVELSSLNGAAASMRAILANVIETSVDSPLYGELARDLPNFTLGGYDDPFLSTSVQKCMKAGDLNYDLHRLRAAAKCIADNVRDVKSRRMMANVELGYWTIYLREKGVTLETIGNLFQFDRMDNHLTDHLRRKDGNRLVVIYNDGSHYQLVADPFWITDVYTTGEPVEPFKPDDEVVNWAKEAQEQEDAILAGDLLLNELKNEIIANLYNSVADDAELDRKIKEVKKIDSFEELNRYSTREDPQVAELKAALVNRIGTLDPAYKDKIGDMIATVNAMTTISELSDYDDMVNIMMSGGASKSTGYLVPAALAFVTLVMSMVPR